MLLKIIACEIAFREICHIAAQSKHLLDLEFLTQGHHENPAAGRADIQQRIDAMPAGKYEAILLGYGLCSSILTGLTTAHTPLVIPRAHDCITFFLGSKERYQKMFASRPGTYYYTSGWLECPSFPVTSVWNALRGLALLRISTGTSSPALSTCMGLPTVKLRSETSRWESSILTRM